ncbi:MAG: hypothetical protein EA351_05095 [Gemmatimonadales bacterium]|nr:MAG: hypothetical protein EA351_05095 [Gemmatimonadales bacterium]
MAQRTRKNKGKKEKEEKSSPNTMVLVLGGVGVLAVAILVWNIVSTATDQTVRSPVDIEYESPAELLAMAEPVVRGDLDAPITLMDFSDYSCNACQAFTMQSKPTLDRAYVDRGLMRFEYYDFPTGMFPNSFTAARAARCAGDQDGYWPFHDLLFQRQTTWGTQADPNRTFEGYAEEVGIDVGEFRSCLRSDRHAEVVTANLELARQLGVAGTPTLMLNTGEGTPVRIPDWRDMQQMRDQIDSALERRGHTPPGAASSQDEDEDDDEGASIIPDGGEGL